MAPTDYRTGTLHQTPTQSQSSSDPSVTRQCPLRGSLYCEAVKTSATLPFFLATGILHVAGAYFFPLAHNFPLSRGLSPPCAASCGTGHTPRRQQTLAKHDKKPHISSSLPTRPPDLLYCPPPSPPPPNYLNIHPEVITDRATLSLSQHVFGFYAHMGHYCIVSWHQRYV